NKCRTVDHFHFRTWEDKGNPRYGAHTLLAFMNRVHSFDEDRNGPLIVHCSAGVGRTGTFIALDILQKTAIQEKTVDIYSCVDRLRRERMIMVQTKEQYLFLHEAVVEFIKSMDTPHDLGLFVQRFSTIRDQRADRIVAALQKEWQANISDDNFFLNYFTCSK
ncbi:hypothetical protein LSH36_2958g00004, partial [Paralvinella palmiformis]